MNICRFLWTTIFRIFGRTCIFYSVFGLSSSPNLFIEPRKNLKGSELDDAKCLQKIRKILRDMFVKKEICQFSFPLCLIGSNFYLDFTS